MNGNGKVIMYLVGVIVTLICFIAIPTLANNVIINDKESRARDEKIADNMEVKFDRIMGGISTINIAQMEMKTEQRYVKEKVDKLERSAR